MGAAEGTVLVDNAGKESIRVRTASDLTVKGGFTSGDVDPNNENGTAGDLYYNKTSEQMFVKGASEWEESKLKAGDIYQDTSDGDKKYVATGARTVVAHDPKQAVLTHGSVNIDDGHAWILDPDSSAA